jgi:hypothetical protein
MSEQWFENLRADFKRIYIEQWGEEGWNDAIAKASLPKWLGFTEADQSNTNSQVQPKGVTLSTCGVDLKKE